MKTSICVNRFGKLIPVKLVAILIPSRACSSEAKGELLESPVIVRSRASLVAKNSVKKLCAMVSFALAGS